jgi:glutamate--cysteine ligase
VCPEAKGVLLIPESHTRNVYYLQNVVQLQSILRMAGMKVRVGTLIPEITQPSEMALPSGAKLVLEPLVRRGNRIGLQDFDPCVVVLNNDLSAGVPPILENLEQQVIPPLYAGWSTRRKSRHFAAYSRVAAEFAKLVDIDPWVIDPYFGMCGEINFQERTGEDCLAGWVDVLLGKVRAKYKEFGIDREPFVIVKADAGTYGMGIMTVKDPSEVRELSRKQRTKMAVVKEGLAVHEVMVQEGVYTLETVNDAVAEPVIYMIDQFVVGGFYRVHTGRGPDENLNAPGMQFEPMPFDTACLLPDPEANPDCAANRFYAYGVIARLALVAAAIELEEMRERYEAGRERLRKMA